MNEIEIELKKRRLRILKGDFETFWLAKTYFDKSLLRQKLSTTQHNAQSPFKMSRNPFLKRLETTFRKTFSTIL